EGDAWLNVQLEWVNPNGPNELADSAAVFGDRVIAGLINPSDLHIRRTIVMPAPEPGVIDTSLYTGPAEEYAVRYIGDGYWEVFHNGATELEESDGRDILHNMEAVR